MRLDDKISEINAFTESHLDEIKKHDLNLVNLKKSIEDIGKQINEIHDTKVEWKEMNDEIKKVNQHSDDL